MEDDWNDEINKPFYITKLWKHKHWMNDENENEEREWKVVQTRSFKSMLNIIKLHFSAPAEKAVI
jgi:hypothetical protein